jgi:hypothetical protein
MLGTKTPCTNSAQNKYNSFKSFPQIFFQDVDGKDMRMPSDQQGGANRGMACIETKTHKRT